jgi:hyaluronan synthase
MDTGRDPVVRSQMSEIARRSTLITRAAEDIKRGVRRHLDNREMQALPTSQQPSHAAAQPSQPVAQPTAAARSQQKAAVTATLLELFKHHDVSDEQLATLTGSTSGEIADRRASALAAEAEREAVGGGLHNAPASPVSRPGGTADLVARVLAGVYLLGLLSAVLYYKSAFIQMITVSPFLSTYGLIVVLYISSRFLFSAFYRPGKDRGLEPHVAIVMPGFNEEAAIANSLRSLLQLDYPADRLEIVAVNDGSTDNTLTEMRKVASIAGGRVRVINFEHNRGKRAAMAAGIRATQADIIAFVDSDSVLEPDAMRILVQGFGDRKVGAICGHAAVLNVRENWMTKMQAVRYFVAFSVNKAAESVFGTVTCCSGCFSAYRREAIMPWLDWWENQTFLGRPSTFGDDRSLTNCVLRKWKIRYEARAVSHTIVPATYKQFMRQQLRWKRSWTRESLIVGSFIWKKNPIPAACAYVGILLPIVAPVVAVHAVILLPAQGGGAPVLYVMGVYAMSVCYGLYYAARKPRYDHLWVYGILFCFFYLAFLLWQTYWAMVTTRSASWGTRPATAGMTDSEPAQVTP